jgi:hypothetical protein
MPPRRVLLETPFTGPTPEIRARNKRYLEACLRHLLLRGDAPFASHKLYTDALDDDVPEERDIGIKAGFVYREVTEVTVVGVDEGISGGMQWGIDQAKKMGHPVENLELGEDWDKASPSGP